MNRRSNPALDALRAKLMSIPTPDSILDEAITAGAENERLRPKFYKVSRILAANVKNEIQAYVDEGFTQDQAVQIYCARIRGVR